MTLITPDTGDAEMKSRNQYHGVFPEAVEVVRYWARHLTKHPAFTPADLEDLEQELMLDLLRRMPTFNPQRSSLASFASMVVSRRAYGLIEEANTAKSGGYGLQVVSLDTTAISDQQGEKVMLLETISDAQGLWFQHGPSWHEVIDTRIDFARFLALLPQRLFALAMRLLRESAAEIARSLQLSQTAIHRAIRKIRSIADRCGFMDMRLSHHPIRTSGEACPEEPDSWQA